MLEKNNFDNREGYFNEWKLQHSIIGDYNTDDSYVHEVSKLSSDIFERFFSEPKDYLIPFYRGEKFSYSEIHREE